MLCNTSDECEHFANVIYSIMKHHYNDLVAEHI